MGKHPMLNNVGLWGKPHSIPYMLNCTFMQRAGRFPNRNAFPGGGGVSIFLLAGDRVADCTLGFINQVPAPAIFSSIRFITWWAVYSPTVLPLFVNIERRRLNSLASQKRFVR